MSKKKKRICILAIIAVCVLAAGFLIWNRISVKNAENGPAEGVYERRVEASLQELKGSQGYRDMTEAEKIDAVEARLNGLAAEGAIEQGSVYRETGSEVFGFRYTDGIAGSADISVPETEETLSGAEYVVDASSTYSEFDGNEKIESSSDTAVYPVAEDSHLLGNELLSMVEISCKTIH